MDFKFLKDKVINASIEAKNGIVKTTDKAVSFGATKLSNSGITIKDKKTLEEMIKKSKNTNFVNKKTGEKKTFKKRVIIIFGSEKSDFFRKALVNYPVLVTKAFYQNIVLKLAISNIKDVDLKTYNINKIPSLVIFENNKVIKIIEGKENITKLVKSLNLDINKAIESL